MKECGLWEDTKVPLSQCNALIALIYAESVPVLQPGFGAECILLPACQPSRYLRHHTVAITASLALDSGGTRKGCTRLKIESWKT